MVPRPLDERTVAALVADATAAPSMHNAQPWRFRFLAGERRLLLSADPERAMPRTDPDERALHLGCGAALFNLRVSAVHAGLDPRVRLLPAPDVPFLLAAVDLAEPDGTPPDAPLARLHPAIRQRHASRYPFAEKTVPVPVLDRLAEAAAEEGAQLVLPHPWHTDTVLDLVRDAESREAMTPQAREEIDRWTRLGPEAASATDGVPEYAFGPRKAGGRAPVRDFAGDRPVADRGAASFEQTPRLALLSTPEDRPADWLRAGQALERVLLEATLAELVTSLTSHALEERDLRRLVRDPGSGAGQVQMVLRLGYGPRGPASPRRPVREVLEIT
ncbi:nitroreductase family protein [Streptomyces sp. SCSIO 75703]|uniref:Acg family FMN-binding oxidoreductase n=1 Tax=unclassified Streptomyces TaxID=2593676 RepID=UPI0004C25BB6|nr:MULTISPECIES: nitroreductase family protein [unclassified Streptomyces]